MTSTTTTEHGTIISVDVIPLGSALSADASAGDTSIIVDDCADFDELGGSLALDGQTIAYGALDDDTGTITLTAALTADVYAGDTVAVWNTAANVAASYQRALVMTDGASPSADPISVEMAAWTAGKVFTGIRVDVGESVLLEVDQTGVWRIVDVLGQDASPSVSYVAVNGVLFMWGEVGASLGGATYVTGTVTFPGAVGFAVPPNITLAVQTAPSNRLSPHLDSTNVPTASGFGWVIGTGDGSTSSATPTLVWQAVGPLA